MKRDPRLHGLSAEHHHALVLARTLKRHEGPWTEADGAALLARFDLELDPHFRVEEDVLLPALRLAGLTQLVDQTLEDHQFLRTSVQSAGRGDGAAAKQFATRLYDHIRFEEREVFPACERLDGDFLDEALRRSPKKSQ